MKNFTYSFISSKPAHVIFDYLQQVNQWWSGLYNETIKGSSKNLQDEFSFSAGGGAHYSHQKLIELVPNKKIVWQVTESNLSFVNKPDEWTNSTFLFTLDPIDKQTKVTFTHIGLQPAWECYESCSNGWMAYLQKLEAKLK